jgi:hypothetical protein
MEYTVLVYWEDDSHRDVVHTMHGPQEKIYPPFFFKIIAFRSSFRCRFGF